MSGDKGLKMVEARFGLRPKPWHPCTRVDGGSARTTSLRCAVRGTRVLVLLLAVLMMGGMVWGEGVESDKVVIEAPLFEGGQGMDFFVQAAREYERLNPHVTVDMYGDPRIADKVRVRILEGSFPEITNAFSSQVDYWGMIHSGDILALDEWLDGPPWGEEEGWKEGDPTWRDTFMEGTLAQYQEDGKTFAIPFLYSPFVVWYNKNMFEEHGWEGFTTWEEFFALCEQIKAEGIVPVAFPGRSASYLQYPLDMTYYSLAGKQAYYDQKYLEPGGFDNPEMIKSIATIRRVTQNYVQPGAQGTGATQAQQLFFNGGGAMIFLGSWLKSEMLGKIPDGFRLGCFNLPIYDTGLADPDFVYLNNTGHFFVFAHSPASEQAVDFMRFMTSKRQMGIFAEMRDITGTVKGSARGHVSDDLLDMVAIGEKAKYAVSDAPGEGFTKVLRPYLDDANYKMEFVTDISVEEIAAKLERDGQRLRYRAENPDYIDRDMSKVWRPILLLGLLGAGALYWFVSMGRRIVVAMKSKEDKHTSGRMKMGWGNVMLFVGPAFLLYTVFVVVPCIKSFSWSFHRYNGLTEMAWIGLQNFDRLLFESDEFWIALGNNLFIMFMVPLFLLPLSLFFAACISRGVKGAVVFRVVFFFPNILGVVAVTLLWLQLYNPQGGPINAGIGAVGEFFGWLGLAGAAAWFDGVKDIAWLSQENLYWSLIPLSVWAACGFNMVLFLAAMQSVPQSIYEAAEIDGASPWRQFWTITIPLIWEVLAIAIVFMVIGGMKVFEQVWLLTGQGPGTQDNVISTLMVRRMFTDFRVGEATAIAVFLFLIVFFGTAVTLRMMRRETVEY